MALVRIDEKTLIQKIKVFIIGSEKPNWATRFSVLLGFAVWVYYAIYMAVISFSILFVDSLKNPDLIRSTFGKIGGKYNFNIKYQSFDWAAIDVILYHAIISILLLTVALIGLVFIYRRRKLGYILYLSGNVSVIIFSVLFLGLVYLSDQVSKFDQLLFIAITLYFFIAMLFLKRGKAKDDTTHSQLS